MATEAPTTQTTIGRQIAETLIDGFDRHYRLFRATSAGAKDRFDEADWAGIQRAMRERIRFYDDRVEESVARLRDDFGGYGSGADGRCGAQGCLLVRMVAAPSALRSSAASGAGAEALWQNARTGLDGWAIASAARQRYAPEDSAVDGVRWGCKGPSVASPPNTSAPILRRWELVGGARSSTGGYAAASVLFNGWEGGRGYDDCEPDSRVFGPRGESWTQHATYTLVTAPTG